MPVYRAGASGASSSCPGCACRDRMPRYPSDMTDAQWKVLEPQARVVMEEMRRATGRPMVHDLRAMVDAIGYVVRNGIEWRALPVDFPPGRRCTRSSSGGASAGCRNGLSSGCVPGCGPVWVVRCSRRRRSWIPSRSRVRTRSGPAPAACCWPTGSHTATATPTPPRSTPPAPLARPSPSPCPPPRAPA
ncbi:transposase [Streptosporangium sp. NPDC002544]|uniref:transposase n=1 Tax=Streptosporangium sp. NPDC002544 TaxID=3154538 RepID=UPI00332776CC